jgi:penicillin-binding protein 1A
MTWALQVRPSVNYKPEKVKGPGDLLKVGDVVNVRLKDASRKDQLPVFILEQEPLVQAALLCIDPRTGYVKAMVGGRSFGESQFNRAVFSRRQPGSAFKPVIYAAALDKGYTPTTLLMDSPVEYPGHDDGAYWAPKNYDKDFMGPITFRNALAHSRNVVTIKILEDIGIGYALNFIKRIGIESPVKRDFSIALGTSGVSMPELTAAFGVFANGGEHMKPIFIEKIVTMKGEVVEENSSYVEFEEREEEEKPPEETYTPPPVTRERVISPQDAYIMTHLLEGVVQHGTGQGAKRLGRPVAGKTGTSSDFMDAWFIGYTPSLLASVWVGFDDKSSLGPSETGARAALPIWTAFMEGALKDMPVESFKVPPGITLMKIDLQTGEPPHEGTQEIVLEAFIDPQAMESLGEISSGPPVDAGLPEAPVDSH